MTDTMMRKAATAAAIKIAAAMIGVSAIATAFAPAAVHAAEPGTVAAAETTEASTRAARTVVHLSDIDTEKESVEIPVEIVNSTGKRLVELYIAPSDSKHWGDDLMGSYYMESGNSAKSSFTAYGNETEYDIYAVFGDDSTGVYTNFDFSDVPTTGLTLELTPNCATTSYNTR